MAVRDQWHVSRALSASGNYLQSEKEELFLIFGICKFHQYLYGRKFTLVTNHQPLTTLFSDKKGISPLAATHLSRWALHLCICSSLYHSILTNQSMCQCGWVGQLKQVTRTDPILSKALMFTKTGWPMQVSEVIKSYWNR